MSENVQLRERMQALQECESSLRGIVAMEDEHASHFHEQEQELDRIQGQMESAQQDQRATQATLERNRRRVDRLAEENENQGKQIERLQREAAELAEENELVKEEAAELHKALDASEQENDELLRRPVRSKSTEDYHLDMIDDLRHEIDELRAREESRHAAMSAAVTAFNMAKSSRDAAEERARVLESRVGMAEDDAVGDLVVTLRSELSALKLTLVSMRQVRRLSHSAQLCSVLHASLF
jgi:chromosome segregation protein